VLDSLVSTDSRVSERLTGKKLRLFLMRNIYTYLGNADISTVEFEGPEIAIYVKNPKFIVENSDVIKELAKKLKKRVVIRTDPSVRKSPEETKAFIMNNADPEAGIDANLIEFDEVLGEVVVRAEKPGKAAGKNKQFINKVLANTGWRMVVYRKPPLISNVLNSILGHMLRSSSERKKAFREIGERIFRDTIKGTQYVRIIGLGSFCEVGRSAILVDTGESKVLLDAGINPGGSGIDRFPRLDSPEFNIEELDAVVISHAHLDHVGILPLLYKYGYRGPVYATKPTRDIMVLVQKDLIELARKEGEEPLYGMREISMMLSRTITVDYEVVTDVAPDTKLTFHNAGHILGSALVHLHVGQGLYNILYTGDLKFYKIKGDTATRLLPPASHEFPRIETLILESTYGATEQQPRDEAEKQLLDVVRKVAERGGKILIPVMAVGRGQEILVVLNEAMKKKEIPEIPVYVDGMVYEVTAIYTNYPELLVPPIRNKILHQGENPFISDNTIYVSHKEERESVMQGDKSAIILATSGMLTGGPSVEYLKALAEDEKNALVFVSYQAAGTLGRRIVEGDREIQFIEEGKARTLRIKMEVQRIEGFSGHASQSELRMFYKFLKPKPRNIILNHGEPTAIQTLKNLLYRDAAKLEEKGVINRKPEIHTPKLLESIKLY
jgi:KH/beta-lactamase-domain protein